MPKHEIYRAEFPDGTTYIGYTSIGIAKRWAGTHNSAVQRRKTRYPKVRPVRVMTCFTERDARRNEANLIKYEARIVLNQRHTNGNSIQDREAPPAVPAEAGGLACDLDKVPTIEMSDGTKHPNPLYKDLFKGVARLIFNQLYKTRSPEVRPSVPADADGIACDLEKVPTIEMADGTKHPNPLYEAKKINRDGSLKRAGIAALAILGVSFPFGESD